MRHIGFHGQLLHGYVLDFTKDHGDRFLNEFTEFIQKPVPMIFKKAFVPV
jgi:hypothetical protein